jgi:hypothetical protein
MPEKKGWYKIPNIIFRGHDKSPIFV